MLGRKSRARSTSWPEAKTSLRGRIHCRRPILVILDFLLAIGWRTIHCPEGVPSPSSSRGEWTESVEGDPNLLWGRSPHLEEARERILGRRACVRRAGLHVARHAERQTERQTGREPACSMDLSWHEIAKRLIRTTVSPLKSRGRTRRELTGPKFYRTAQSLAFAMVLRM